MEAEYMLCAKKRLLVIVPVKMVLEAGNIYTKAIFEEFQHHCVKSLVLYVESKIEDSRNVMHKLRWLDLYALDVKWMTNI